MKVMKYRDYRGQRLQKKEVLDNKVQFCIWSLVLELKIFIQGFIIIFKISFENNKLIFMI